MRILHILKKEPTDTTKKIIENHSLNNDVKVVELYKGGVDYAELVEFVFGYDRVFCW